jgi:DNA relaxase NicK
MGKKRNTEVETISGNFAMDNPSPLPNGFVDTPLGQLAARNSNTALDSHPHGTSPQHMVPMVDWLSLSFCDVNIDKLIESIQNRLHVSIHFDKYSIVKHGNKAQLWYKGTMGVQLGITNTGALADRYGDVLLLLPGRLCSSVKSWALKSFCREMFLGFDCRCTRIDIKVDDYDEALDFPTMIDAVEKGNIAGFQKGKYIQSYGGEDAGRTLYLGTRRSNKFGRIYERAGVTKGAEKCYRFEVEYKRSMAQAVFLVYINAEEDELADVLGGILKKAFLFLNKTDKNVLRCEVFSWWNEFLDRIVSVAVQLEIVKPVPSIDATVRWVHRSVSKSIGKMREALGKRATNVLLKLWSEESKVRFTNEDNFQISEWLACTTSLGELIQNY